MPQVGRKKVSNNFIPMFFENKDDLLFFYYESNHPKRIDIEQFIIGRFRLHHKDKIYWSQLKSKSHLNPSVNWSSQTFTVMIESMNGFTIQRQEIDQKNCLFLVLNIRVRGQAVNLLRLQLNQQIGGNFQNQLWKQFQEYTSFKEKMVRQKDRQRQKIDKQIQQKLNRLQKVQQDEKKQVNEIKGMMSLLLNQKQKKLMQVSGNKQIFTYKLKKQSESEKKVQSGTVNWLSSQDDRMLIGSLFSPSQQFII